MKRCLFLTIILILFSLLAVNTFATTYYVATTGNNADPGTEAEPWATLSHAESNVNAGDTIIVRGGTYNERLIIDVSGTSGNLITFQNYSGETVIIDGQDTIPSNNWNGLVHIYGSYITIDGFEIKRSNGQGVITEGDYAGGGDYVTIKNCTLHHHFRSGIFFQDYADYCLAEDNVVYQNAQDYFSVGTWSAGISNRKCSNMIVRGNAVYQNYGEGIMMDKRSHDCTVEENVIYENRAVELYCNCVKDIIVRNNLVYGTTDTTYWRSGAPSQGIVIQNEQDYCFSENYDGGHKIYGNLVANCGRSFMIWESPYAGTFQGISVYNNTFVEANYPSGTTVAIGIQDTVSTFIFKNNIIKQTAGTMADVPSSGITMNYNLWSREPENDAKGANDPTYTPLLTKTSGWNSLNSGDLDGSEFALQTTSPAIDVGVNLGTTYDDGLDPTSTWPDSVSTLDQDLYGAGWEIGAFVFDLTIYNASPDQGDTGVSITTDLNWTNPTGATNIDLLFDVKSAHDPPTTVRLNDQNVETWDCGTLAYNTEYAWRVDVNHAGGTETGTVYYFTTTSQANPPTPEGSGMVYHKQGVSIVYGKGLKIQ